MAAEVRLIRDDDEWLAFARLSIDTFGGDEPVQARAQRWRDGYGRPSIGLLALDGAAIIGGVLAWIDDKKVVDIVHAGRKLSIRSEVDLSQPLGIATWLTKAALRNIELKKLPDDAE